MKKTKIIVIIFWIIVTIIVIGLIAYNFLNKNNLTSKTTSVNDIDTNVKLDTSDEEIEWSNYEKREIILTKSITITEAGVYNLSGKIEDGVITINTDGDVKLCLNDVTITNSKGPAICVESANTVVISTSEGTTNTLTDSSTYSGYDEDTEGAIYSKDDLVLEGTGTLVAKGNKGDAIVCKDDLKINEGTYIIKSADDAIRGKDSVYILDGTFTIEAKGDGIKSTNAQESDKGYVKIENGAFDIVATLDGIQAENKILIENGTFNITTGGGATNSSQNSGWGNWGNGNTSSSSDSAKGIKAGDSIVISNGTFIMNTSDDSVHSNNYIGISQGNLTISSGDDGIHADTELVVDNGIININKSYEGMEAQTITINNGEINIVSSDDGINVAGGNDGSAMNRPGASMNSSNSESVLTINGGIIYIDASGDGLDANGSIYINGGTITVDGPSNNGNGALDYEYECVVNGGILVATGESGMAQGASSSSTQYSVLINFTNNYSSGTVVTIENSNQEEVLSYTGSKNFSSIVFSSNKLAKETYTIKINGNTYQTFTINNISTIVGNFSGMGGAGGKGMGGNRR